MPLYQQSHKSLQFELLSTSQNKFYIQPSLILLSLWSCLLARTTSGAQLTFLDSHKDHWVSRGEEKRKLFSAGICLVLIFRMDVESQALPALNHLQLKAWALLLPHTHGPKISMWEACWVCGRQQTWDLLLFKSKKPLSWHSRPLAICSCISQDRIWHATVS